MNIPRPNHHRGFTLIELLVALAILASLALISWQSITQMKASEDRLQRQTEAVALVQTALSQWSVDLDAVAIQPDGASIDWDGRALRILRQSSEPDASLRVVAWSNRPGGNWMRWQSAPLRSHRAFQEAWLQAARWAQNPSEQDRLAEVQLFPLASWQVFFYRGNAWSNPLSSEGDTASNFNPNPLALAFTPTRSKTALPDSVRLVIVMPEDAAFNGTLTRDWVYFAGNGAKP